MLARAVLAGVAAALAIAGCSSQQSAPAPYDPRDLPPGPVGRSVSYGYSLITETHRLMRNYVRADLTCANCHIAAGMVPRGGSFVGTYARFPQWSRRAHRVIALQDRIAECFLYSMNGKAPAYDSKPMIAIVAYIAWLSRGTPIGAKETESDSYMVPLPSASPDVARGKTLYGKRCEECHQADGGGVGSVYPPLWGARSFNQGAGMAHIDRMTGFVRYNMPQNAPGSLTLEQAYDVSAFVLSHPRPRFHRNALVTTPSLPAKYF